MCPLFLSLYKLLTEFKCIYHIFPPFATPYFQITLYSVVSHLCPRFPLSPVFLLPPDQDHICWLFLLPHFSLL